MNRVTVAAVLLLATLAARADDEPGARAKALQAEMVSVIAAVRPSVVSIEAIMPAGPAPERRRRGGSGVVVSEDGFVLTNYHVAGEAARVTVILAGPRRVPATVHGRDPGGDLALLKLEGDGPWPAVALGDSDGLCPGQWVLAMGNPRGLSSDGRATVTWGTITALHSLGGGDRSRAPGGRFLFYGDALQTDAEINPGNSGGPLFDLAGRLVGINGRIASRDRDAEGRSATNANVGFAIPASQIRRFLPALKAGGLVRHGLLGVRVSHLDGEPVTVAWVRPGSAAESAGVRPGDRLLALDGDEITTPLRLMNLVSARPAGDRIALRLERAGGLRVLVFPLGVREDGREEP